MNSTMKPFAHTRRRPLARFCDTAGGSAGQGRCPGVDRRSMIFSLLPIAAAPVLDRSLSMAFEKQQPKAAKPSGVNDRRVRARV